ncbi:27.1 kDa [Spodoptera frugiperda ascovirus 1a]|uniref:27.1 kDa n=1 Tax=Spodoptera frugiperda ascovirus 1a TaxID=113370 RepID=Q0E557_SFAVA|nr:27.1 kDa [Spodoptera frugiperda ascovirus 1a]CAL44644.1 27.1 kDa [Spodoptera frugiperda ascovirus 1a]
MIGDLDRVFLRLASCIGSNLGVFRNGGRLVGTMLRLLCTLSVVSSKVRAQSFTSPTVVHDAIARCCRATNCCRNACNSLSRESRALVTVSNSLTAVSYALLSSSTPVPPVRSRSTSRSNSTTRRSLLVFRMRSDSSKLARNFTLSSFMLRSCSCSVSIWRLCLENVLDISSLYAAKADASDLNSTTTLSYSPILNRACSNWTVNSFRLCIVSRNFCFNLSTSCSMLSASMVMERDVPAPAARIVLSLFS